MTLVLLCLIACLAVSVFSIAPSVTVVQPLDDQLPLVARVNQPFSWTFSPYTFNSTDGPLRYSTSALPAWLTFDDASQTFHGTPGTDDQGYPEITVTAHASGSSTSSKFSFCVTYLDPPVLTIPISTQFNPNSSSLSSIFFLHQNSAIGTENPTLRVPRKWSFSVGFEMDTFVSPAGRNMFYELRLANGSSIPDYLSFNSKTATLDGVIPSADEITQPYLLPFTIHASDQEGYTAATATFALVLADHEASMNTKSLPTINITAETEFMVSLLSSADFSGVMMDDEPIQPSNISALEIDVAGYNWLRYDSSSRTLSGTPGSDVTGTSPMLPVTLSTVFNQTINTFVHLAIVEPYFVMSNLPSLNASKGDEIQFNLAQWFSQSAANPGDDKTNISVSLEPTTAANFLRFDERSTNLTGTIADDYAGDSITATFTAYSHITHSTSHTAMVIYISGTGNDKSLAPTRSSGLSTAAHKKLVLALVLSFGMIGGLLLIAGIFAVVRRCARVEDTALLGEEGRAAWSEKDRHWYGLTLSPRGTRVIEKNSTVLFNTSPQAPSYPTGLPVPSSMGLDLRRVSERSQQYREEVTSPGVMSKKEFMTRLRETVRQVSDKYARRQRPSGTQRPVIGKPVLVASTRASGHAGSVVPNSPTNPFEDTMPLSRPGSTFMTGSPSASTAEHSIPRRRPDFAPPRNPAAVHFNDGLLVRQVSTGSVGGTSYVSGLSGEGESVAEVPMGPPTRPRLVPFTSSTRVPVPQAIGMGAPPVQGGGFVGNRITSQRAKVCKVDSKDGNVIIEEGSIRPSGTSDELSMGMHYVRSLGADQLTVNGGASGTGTGTVTRTSPATSNVRSSFTSLESSHLGNKSGAEGDAMKVLVRMGERFKFKISVPSTSANGRKRTQGYYIKTTSGQPLPKFIQPDLNGISTKGVLELTGVATFRDIGETAVGVYAEKDGACVVTIIIEVVGKR